MMLGAHAALPIIGITTIDIYRLSTNKKRLLTNWQLFFVGIGGILPDVLWPHLTMQGRLTSYTHTLWFILMLIPITYFASKRFCSENIIVFTCSFVLAALLHIATDGISGGVSFLYPVNEVWGSRIIAYALWLKADISLLSLTLILTFIRHKIASYQLQKVKYK